MPRKPLSLSFSSRRTGELDSPVASPAGSPPSSGKVQPVRHRVARALSACQECPPQRSTGESMDSLDDCGHEEQAAEVLELHSQAVRNAAHAVARARAELTRQLQSALREIDGIEERVEREDLDEAGPSHSMHGTAGMRLLRDEHRQYLRTIAEQEANSSLMSMQGIVPPTVAAPTVGRRRASVEAVQAGFLTATGTLRELSTHAMRRVRHRVRTASRELQQPRRAVVLRDSACVLMLSVTCLLNAIDRAVRPFVPEAVLYEAATVGVNASVVDAYQLSYSSAYVIFFGTRCAVWLLMLVTAAWVFCHSNDGLVLRRLRRSAPAIVWVLKLLAYLLVTCRVAVVKAPFSPLVEASRFLLEPCTYAFCMLLFLACDFNRRAQKLRWGFFAIGLACTRGSLPDAGAPLQTPARPSRPVLCASAACL